MCMGEGGEDGETNDQHNKRARIRNNGNAGVDMMFLPDDHLLVADQAPRVGRDGVGVRGDRHLGGDAEQGAGDQGGGARAHRGHRSAGKGADGGGVFRVIHVVSENLLLT